MSFENVYDLNRHILIQYTDTINILFAVSMSPVDIPISTYHVQVKTFYLVVLSVFNVLSFPID